MNLLLGIVLVILMACAFFGYRKGFIKTVFAIFSMIVALMISLWFGPVLSNALKSNEKVYGTIKQKVEETLEKKYEEEQKSVNLKSQEQQGQSKEQLKETQQDKDENQAKQKTNTKTDTKEDTKEDTKTNTKANTKTDTKENVQDSIKGYENEQQNTEDAAADILESLKIPKILKGAIDHSKTMIDGEPQLANKISAYASDLITNLIINAIAFIVMYLIAAIALQIICSALNIISKLPVLNQINKLSGLCVGGIQGLLIVWILFVVLLVMSGSNMGQQAFTMISESQFLSFLYNNNLLLKLAISLFGV